MSKKLILNPAYYLRNDVYRCVIGSFEFVDFMEDGEYDPHSINLIHPIVAQFLSFFSNNEASYEQTLLNISKYFHLSIEEIEDIIRPMIENDTPLTKEIQGNKTFLPRKLLVTMPKVMRKETYKPQDFVINGDLDLKTNRLYIPLHAVLELTMQCHTDCVYCYADRRLKKNVFLATNIAVDFIKNAKALGFTDIEINGGEVLLHPGIKKILETLVECGYNSLISTKMPIDEVTVKYLKRIGITRLQISVDSLNDVIAKQMIHKSDVYIQRLIKTMELLDLYEFHWHVNTVLTKINCDLSNIKNLIDFLQKYHHLESVKLSPMGFPMYKEYHTFDKLHASSEQLLTIKEYSKTLNSDKYKYKLIVSEEDKELDYLCKKWDTFNERPSCTANRKAFNVLPDGQVTICEELYWNPSFIIGDISHNDIMEIWNSPKAKELFFISEKKISKESVCHDCFQLTKCRHYKGVCWKMVIMAYGDNHWDFPDPRCPNAPFPLNKFYV